jgi:putative transposase
VPDPPRGSVRFGHASATLILRTLVADGRIAKDAVSPVTVRRLFRARGLDRQTLDNAHPTQRLRWQAERPNALWHADVCHGAPLRLPDGDTQPVRIHALLDDATRYILAIEAFSSEQEIDMLQLWVRALRRHGAPQVLYLDNGSTYRGDALRLACARLGTTLLHAKPYDAPARGKMERFWRTLRAGCLDHLGAMSSLHEVNVRLYAFVDQHYHRAPHASLLGRAPDEVWRARAAERPDDALDDAAIREALTVRNRRRVRKPSLAMHRPAARGSVSGAPCARAAWTTSQSPPRAQGLHPLAQGRALGGRGRIPGRPHRHRGALAGRHQARAVGRA